MRNYELAYIADPDLDESALTALEEKVKGWIDAAGGSVVQGGPLGQAPDGLHDQEAPRRPLLLRPSRHAKRGRRDLERNLRLTEQVLRFMITLQEAA